MKLPVSRFTVNGNSMVPSLRPGQDVVSFNWAYFGRRPNVGDIVVVEVNGRQMVKRIEKVMGDEFVVMGDNKGESTDSRDFGAINLDQIVGKVIYRSGVVDCPQCGSEVVGIYGRKDAICRNCGFKLVCCGEP